MRSTEIALKLGYTIDKNGIVYKENRDEVNLSLKNGKYPSFTINYLNKSYMIYASRMQSYMKYGKILLLPSKWEGYGLVAVEALAFGVPVVCSGVGGLTDIINDRCGKICGNEIDLYVDEILHLLSEKKYYIEKSSNAKNRAYELNNITEYIQTLDNIYEGCLAHGNSM